MITRKMFISCLFSFLFVLLAKAQEPLFWNEIQAFKKEDSIKMPPKNAILFVGSSSFRMWKNVQEMFPGYTIINRGFGGSSLPDVIRYANDIIFPYQPKQVVIYCGENDFMTDSVDSRIVTERFKTLFRQIRQRIPGIPIVFISMKPSPSREKYLPAIKEANQMINNFLWQEKNAGYVDVYKLMLGANGKPDSTLFLQDMLHMNQEGYKIWQEALRPYLLRN
jgi:lysophospholipase L1-like esterase